MTAVGTMSGGRLSEEVGAPAERAREFRVLFCCWTELDITSGTPVVVEDLLRHFPPGHARAFVEANADHRGRRRAVETVHPIGKYRLHTRLWPFRRGSRVRNRLARLGLPVLVAEIVSEIRRFRPDCLFAVYARPHWILATWLAAKLTGTPLIYHVHDAFLEANERRRNSHYCRWLERKTLTTSRVLVLDDYVADHYRNRYGIECTVLRHVVKHPPLAAREDLAAAAAAARAAGAVSQNCSPARPITIGFAGAVYDSNLHQLADLCRVIGDDANLRVKIWTGSTPEQLAPLGISGERVEIAFEPDIERWFAGLNACDLLYLPLHFEARGSTASGAMELSLPTKSFDYLVAGSPILVHCPEHFSLSRFFNRYRCGYVLNEPGAAALKNWLASWRAGKIPPLTDSQRREALAMCSPEENKRILWEVLSEEVERATSRGSRPRTKRIS